MKENKQDMTLWMLAWPIFLEMLLQFLLGAVDILMVSDISDDAVAVIGISTQLFNAANILFMAIASGAGILVAQKLGAKRMEDARTIGIMGTMVCMGIGMVLSVLLFFGAGSIAQLLQLPVALQPLGETYISIVGAGMVFMAAMAVLGTIIRNTGNTRGPMYVSIGINIIHVILNYAFIYGAFGFPQWGLAGVALSTAISRLIGTVILFVMFQNSFSKQVSWKDLGVFDKPLFKETLKLSWPLGVGMSSWCFTQLVIFSFTAMLGAKELSARTYLNTLESFCFLIGFSIAMAGQIYIAHYYGSGYYKETYRSAYKVLWVGLGLVMANTLLLVVVGKQALMLFTADLEIIALGVSLLAVNLLLQPAKMLNMAIGSALNAVGDTRFNMIIGLFSMWLVAVGLSYYLGITLGWGLFGIYAAMILDELLRGGLTLLRWRAKRFMKKPVFREEFKTPSEAIS
ncbi:MATE family efflux transporter [Ammoniphilus sp. YIM 78166]|uniref:MATE family efflux transporter n=1 Tax=Ammoniphilus sp. YIM 78166 TaxID=1644106 RepID=UPI00106FACA5|nr:MATE family efflux transporter [Ammoniphilus sp. YIM 78166]